MEQKINSSVEELITTTENCFELFISQLQSFNADFRDAYLLEVTVLLRDNHKIGLMIEKIMKKTAEIDGYPQWFNYQKDAEYIQQSEQSLFSIEATNNWVVRKQREVQQILTFIERKHSQISVSLSVEPIKIIKIYDEDVVTTIMYENLFPKFITCSKDNFSLHFKTTELLEKIKWEKTEAEIKVLFALLKKYKIILETDDNVLIERHFINKKGKFFKADQIGQKTKDKMYLRIMDKIILHPIMELIETILKTPKK